MTRLLDWLGIVRGVYLLSTIGGDIIIYRTYIRKQGSKSKVEAIFGFPLADQGLTVYIYPFSRIGHATLLPGGIIKDHYCSHWRYMHETQ